MRLGFACSWWRPRDATWSYTANRLRAALDAHADVVDIETQRGLPLLALEVAAGRATRRPWQYSHVERALVDRRARRGVIDQRPDVVLGIADVDTPLSVPTFLYQDLTFALGLACRASPDGAHVNLLPGSASRMASLATRGIERIRRATGVFAMSQWLADDVIARGVPAERVCVVHAGMSEVPVPRDPNRPVEGRVLFVGVDFVRKGGDAVLAAVAALRRRGTQARLTIIGPPSWPLPEPPPPWIDFRGSLAASSLRTVWAEHDVFVLPSRFEAYGMVVAEALAAGLPCVVRNAFALPEFVSDGRTGRLVEHTEPDEIADAVQALLDDPVYLARVAAERPAVLARHSWDAVARRMTEFIAVTA